MPFRKKAERMSADIITLIDIIFLLLIFFLLTTGAFRLGEAVERKEQYVTSRRLPESAGISVYPNEPLKNLLIRIEEDSASVIGPGVKLVYFVEPGTDLAYSLAFKKAKEDSNFVALSVDTLMTKRADFLASGSSRQIRSKIHSHRELLRTTPPNDRIIEISADRNTPFRLIYFLMEQCSNGDTLTAVKKVNIRTLGTSASEE
jgi:biopolymer transport protein ExbD